MTDRSETGKAAPAQSAAGDGPPDGLAGARRHWSAFAIILGLTVSVLDSSIANVALPTIAQDLKAQPAASIWVLNAYQIALAALLLPLAALGEVIGYRRIAQAGLAVFTLASLACGLADSLAMLTAARVLQGIGAAGIISVTSALVRFTYPHRMLGRAMGVNAVVVSMSAAMGPTIASGLLSIGDWRLLFLVNVPVGIVATAVSVFSLPATPRTARPLNLIGALLCAATFGLAITGLQSFAHGGEGLALGLVQLGAAIAAGIALARRERGRPHPIVPLDLLRVRLFALSAAAAMGTFVAQMMAYVALPFELHQLGYSAVETGLLLTPWPLAIAVAAPLAGRLADRYPPGLLSAVGCGVFFTGLFALGTLPANHGIGDIVWRMALCGIGFGFSQTPNNRAMVACAPRERSGAAGGAIGTVRVLGQGIGAAGAALAFHTAAPEIGARAAVLTAAGFALAAMGVSLLRGKERPALASDVGKDANSEAGA
ncbi:MAG: MFS transporter [Hyphomonadaceae bacterium]|nr:MFS transporter [Hyphomonadaceae bacterium]